MRSANGLKLKEKLIADSFVREAQINKHHTDSASLLYIWKLGNRVTSGVNKIIR